MYSFITILISVVCILLICTVLVQNAKGGGLAQNFAGQQQLMGVRKTTDFLVTSTWTLAVAIVLLSFVSVKMISTVNETSVSGSAVDQLLENVQSQQQQPNFATPVENPAADETPVAE